MAMELPRFQAGKPHHTRTVSVVEREAAVPSLPCTEVEAAADYAIAEKAEATRRAYKTDFTIFQTWCADRGANALPAEPATVATFLAWEASRSRPNTIGRRAAAIR